MDKNTFLQEEYHISPQVMDLVERIGADIKPQLDTLMERAEMHQYRVIRAMQRAGLSDRHFHPATGYGYDDVGREIVEAIYADVFGAEDALVRPHISSGTHAISLCLYGVLRPGDEILAITGAPYDTIRTVIGYEEGDNGNGTLKDFGISYKQVDLKDGQVDYDGIRAAITDKTKMVYLQRSTGYSWRKALTLADIQAAIAFAKEIKPDVVAFVDNCYGEFLDDAEPVSVGADLMAGSLIKNPGGGIAPTGGYVVGKKEYVYMAACRLAAPGVAKETGATGTINRTLLQGFFLAPTVVAQALQSAVLMAAVYEKLGFAVCPGPEDYRSDIIQSIKMGTAAGVEVFCQATQEAAPVDAFVTPIPWEMPGYQCPVIMAAGAFIQGSSIELSADAPMREPYIVYFQGGLTHFHGKLGLILTLQRLKDAGIITLD
ncbi:Cystathionine beta-lyase family protein involved in aluminum resistance [Eubacterium aggregans]|uniref:Cystathionine beta-lyase family protein involved in aluminum resistance n=1 Tax=Eubacterium aggregans TaxID=81409 RepID=A0A1H3ZNG5_9FIRM|nr:methionine gamma-lyase family protein [Eubacterium aggregans]SEA24804.1 Cystathionine beta-lyase family protein involved in aluminum resistance [Eubacterium aggregans]